MCTKAKSNLCLRQMVTAATVRAKHGPRQPRPLLKPRLGGKDGRTCAPSGEPGTALAHLLR
jgi:hypothetical protein